MSNLDSLCARAWSDVKSPTDPEYDACVPDWRRTLRNRAEAILRGESVSTLDNVLARFEARVRELGTLPLVFDATKVDPAQLSGVSGNILAVDDGTTLDAGNGPTLEPASPSVDEQASSDARTVRNSKPTPEDDEAVSKAAKRLSKRGSAKRAATKAPAKKKAKK